MLACRYAPNFPNRPLLHAPEKMACGSVAPRKSETSRVCGHPLRWWNNHSILQCACRCTRNGNHLLWRTQFWNPIRQALPLPPTRAQLTMRLVPVYPSWLPVCQTTWRSVQYGRGWEWPPEPARCPRHRTFRLGRVVPFQWAKPYLADIC